CFRPCWGCSTYGPPRSPLGGTCWPPVADLGTETARRVSWPHRDISVGRRAKRSPRCPVPTAFRHLAHADPTRWSQAWRRCPRAGTGPPMLSRVFWPAKPLLWFFAAGLALLSASRIALALWKFDQVAQVGGWAEVLLQGVRVDIATLCMLFAAPTVAVLARPSSRRVHLAVSAWLALCM